MTILDQIYAYGHKNILCTHKTTIEITKDHDLTSRGNCILGINASKACYDLNKSLKSIIKSGNKVKVTLKVANLTDTFHGYGNKKLTLIDRNDIVFRKSNFICGRTILIRCTKSSNDLNRELINNLNDHEKKITIIFELTDSDE